MTLLLLDTNVITDLLSQAAQFWATMRSQGRQLGDPDLLLAAMAYRWNTPIVSSDHDFDALPITRLDWRQS